MVGLSFGSCSGINTAIYEIRRSYEPHFSQYPALPTAVLIYQLVLFGSACSAFYAVWVLYRRVPGTLFLAQRAFIFTIVLRMAAGWLFNFYARLPYHLRVPMDYLVWSTLLLAVSGTAWYLYLAISKRVREIYSAEPVTR
jgi:hypothetical protein